MIRYVVVAFLACVLVAPLGWADAQAEGAIEFDGRDVRLLWPAEASAPNEWAVNAGPGSPAPPEWHSIVSRDAGGAPLSLHLRLDGPAIAFGPWREGSDGSLARLGGTDGGAFEITQTLARHASLDYRLRATVAVARRSDASADAAAPALALTLGPGLGEVPDTGFGYAQGLYSFVEAIGSIDGRVVTYPPSAEEPHVLDTEQIEALDWIGLHSRYFALILTPVGDGGLLPSAVVRPEAAGPSGAVPAEYLPSVSLSLAAEGLAPGQTREWQFVVFAGPKSRAALDAPGNDLTRLLFPSLWEWMRWLSFGLWAVLTAIHSVIPNWGLAILVLAVLVRLALYPLARSAFRKQARFAAAQEAMRPELTEINKIPDGLERNERIMALYKQRGVSPAAGMLPLLIILLQFPIFVALFHLLGQAFELRSASFLWIDSLAQPDQLFRFGAELPLLGAYFNLLPVLMAMTTVASIITPPTDGKKTSLLTANNIFFFSLGLVFFVLLYPFPSGMVLYWTAANLLHLGQGLWHRQRRRVARSAE